LGLPEALATLNELKEKEIIKDYAIGGGWAVIYHGVPYTTYDVDIFVMLKDESDYHRLYDHFREKGNRIEDVYIYIGDMPIQFLPNYIKPLFNETIEQAHEIEIEGIPSKVARVEHLIVLALDAFRTTDKYRIIQLQEKANSDFLDKLLERFDDGESKLHKRYRQVLART
jgi:predicted nucleotidyltransferase